MKKRIALLLSAVMILALFAIPVSAANKVYNLIDENGADWTDVELNGNKTTRAYAGGKLTITAGGAWPYTQSALKTPLSFKASDNATLNLKFTVESAASTSSVRLVSGTEDIWLHDFIKDAPIEAGSGDILGGSYELSIKLFDLKMFDALVDGKSTSKDLVLVDGALAIDGIEVWCSGAGPITVTIEKFEIVVPGSTAPSKPVNVAAGKSYTLFGLHLKTDGTPSWPDESGKDLTDGKFAASAGYGDAAYLGLNKLAKDLVDAATEISEVVVDLEKKESLSKFVFYTMTNAGAGITAPEKVTVYVSDDKTTWTEVGTLTYDKDDVSADGKYVGTLEKAASGRYVKFANTHKTNWVFIDEVEIFNTGSGTPAETSDFGVIGFAFIALVSLAGAALVSKKRA